MKEDKRNLQETAVIAKVFNQSERRVQQLAQDGVIPYVSRRPYMFDLLPTIQAYINYLTAKAYGREKDDKTAAAEYEKLRAEADLKKEKLKIAKMQSKELDGKLHRTEDVLELFYELVYSTRSAVMSIPARVAMDTAAAKTALETERIVRAECIEALNGLSSFTFDPEKFKEKAHERYNLKDLYEQEKENTGEE